MPSSAGGTPTTAEHAPSRDALPPRAGSWWSRAWGWAKTLSAHWSEDECGTRAASLSFYTAFSLAPSLVGDQGGQLLTGMLERADQPGQGLSAVFAAILLIVGATTAFAQLKDS